MCGARPPDGAGGFPLRAENRQGATPKEWRSRQDCTCTRGPHRLPDERSSWNRVSLAYGRPLSRSVSRGPGRNSPYARGQHGEKERIFDLERAPPCTRGRICGQGCSFSDGGFTVRGHSAFRASSSWCGELLTAQGGIHHARIELGPPGRPLSGGYPADMPSAAPGFPLSAKRLSHRASQGQQGRFFCALRAGVRGRRSRSGVFLVCGDRTQEPYSDQLAAQILPYALGWYATGGARRRSPPVFPCGERYASRSRPRSYTGLSLARRHRCAAMRCTKTETSSAREAAPWSRQRGRDSPGRAGPDGILRLLFAAV